MNMFANAFYTGKAIGDNWQLTLIYNFQEDDIGKGTFAGQEFWLFTEKARKVFEPLLKDSVEYLPLVSRKHGNKKISYTKQLIFRKAYKPLLELVHTEPHYLINIRDIRSVEVIDFKNSDLDYIEDTQKIIWTESMAFHPKKITNAHIFKIMNHGEGLARKTFVSDNFRKIYEKNGLRGLAFEQQGEDEKNLIWQTLQS